MGQEFAQRSEWNEARALDWNLLDYPAHEGVHRLLRDLNRAYRETPALHARDCEPDGFTWLVVDDHENSVFAWLRKAPDAQPVAVISNFTPVPRHDYHVPLPTAGRWREIVNTDAQDYGGSGVGNAGVVTAVQDGKGIGAKVLLPPLATIFLQYDSAGEA
jgi:1,4-alpha-glucan branching enzyme